MDRRQPIGEWESGSIESVDRKTHTGKSKKRMLRFGERKDRAVEKNNRPQRRTADNFGGVGSPRAPGQFGHVHIGRAEQNEQKKGNRKRVRDGEISLRKGGAANPNLKKDGKGKALRNEKNCGGEA